MWPWVRVKNEAQDEMITALKAADLRYVISFAWPWIWDVLYKCTCTYLCIIPEMMSSPLQGCMLARTECIPDI